MNLIYNINKLPYFNLNPLNTMKKTCRFLLIFLVGLMMLSYSLQAQLSVEFDAYISNNCEPAVVEFYNYTDTTGYGYLQAHWELNGHVHEGWVLPDTSLPRGHYEVWLRFYDQSMNLVGEEMQSFDINGTLANSIEIYPPGEACPGEEIELAAHEDVWWIEWHMEDGKVYYNTYEKHTFYETGEKNITVIGSNICGTDTIVKTINITDAAKPTAQIIMHQGNDHCPNQEIIFESRGKHPTNSWTFGNETKSGKTVSHFYSDTSYAEHEVILNVTNICNNQDIDTGIIHIQTDQPAYAEFEYNYNSSSELPCPNTEIKFIPHGSGTYRWDFGDGNTSSSREPVNYYASPGEYQVQLIVSNGCGNSDTTTQQVFVGYDPYSSIYANFWIDVDHEMEWDDTLEVCPGEELSFINDSDSETPVTFNWDFGDGTTRKAVNAKHTFVNPGIYDIWLKASNVCGAKDSMSQTIKINPELHPYADLNVTPYLLCPGETVYFYDNEFTPRRNYSYSVIFGDGTREDNITKTSDLQLQTLVNKKYDNLGSYNFAFTVTNSCNITDTLKGIIEVKDDSSIKPFYYVENSTMPYDDQGKAADMSTRQESSDHKFTIPVQWADYNPELDSTFFIFIWYDELDTVNNDRPPDGYVEFQSSTIVTGDVVEAFVPINPEYPLSVGLALTYYANPRIAGEEEPDLWSVPLDGSLQPQFKLPITPGGTTELSPQGIILQGTVEESAKYNPTGKWHYYDGNQHVYLSLYDDGYYNLESSATGDYNDRNLKSSGNWQHQNDTLYMEDTYNCYITGNYEIRESVDSLSLLQISDECSERTSLITNQAFQVLNEDFHGDYFSACIGDEVYFQVVGGVSHEWNFGDNSPVSTEQYPVHSYSDTGTYNAYVIATNACERVDTIYTKVKIGLNNQPEAWFNINSYNIAVNDTVKLMYGDDRPNNYTYLWDFGDGNTSTDRNPEHVYTKKGDYEVRLKVTNGCGSNEEYNWIHVGDPVTGTCQAKFMFNVAQASREINFINNSAGTDLIYYWEFGDGKFSTEENPVHVYEKDGIYKVCLSIKDTENDCSHQVCRLVTIGTIDCMPEFNHVVNNANNSVNLTNLSTNATQYFWSFGDDEYSDETSPTHVYAKPGKYNICLIIHNPNTGCEAEICRTVEVGQVDSMFRADFSYFIDPDSNVVKFKNESNGLSTHLYWTFGDGKMGVKANPFHKYDTPGIYEVCLSMFNENTSQRDNTCKEVMVGIQECDIKANFAYLIDNTTNKVTLIDKSNGDIADWFWNFGDGTTSTKPSPVHEFEPGFHLVSLAVKDASSECMDYYAAFIKVGSTSCAADFEYVVNPVTKAVEFTSLSEGSSPKLFWNFGDGYYSTDTNPVHKYSKPGVYHVSLTVNDAGGTCSDFIEMPVQVGDINCKADFEVFVDSISNKAYFRSKVMGEATQLLWMFGDGSVSEKPNPTHQYTHPGYYPVVLSTFNATNNCMDSYEKVVLIGEPGVDCEADFAFYMDSATREVEFIDRSIGNPVDYVWNFGDGNLSNEPNPVHTFMRKGFYNVCLNVFNDKNIPHTKCKVIRVTPNHDQDCRANYSFTIDSVNKSVTFADNSFGEPDTWFWDFGDNKTSNIQNPIHAYDTSGYYLVVLATKNSKTGCSSKHYELINVSKGNNGIRAGFGYEIDSIVTKAGGKPVNMVGVGVGSRSRAVWDFGDGEKDSTTFTPTHEYYESKTYTVCLTISDPNTKDSDTDCKEIKIDLGTDVSNFTRLDSELMAYPNPFSNYTTIAFDLSREMLVDLTLFDVSGRKIITFTRSRKTIGEHRVIWDGSNLESGTYIIQLKLEDGTSISRMLVKQ